MYLVCMQNATKVLICTRHVSIQRVSLLFYSAHVPLFFATCLLLNHTHLWRQMQAFDALGGTINFARSLNKLFTSTYDKLLMIYCESIHDTLVQSYSHPDIHQQITFTVNQLLIYSTSIPMKHGNPGNPEKFRGHQERLGRAENRRGSESSEANSAPCGSQSAFVGRIVGGNTSVHYHLNHPKVFNI